jgi:hypothetical protein
VRHNALLNRFTFVSVLGAALLWGGWAYFVNRHSPNSELVLRTAVAQGIYSAMMTIYMSFAVYFFWSKTKHLKYGGLLPTVFTAGHTGALLTLMHWVNGTPHVLRTVSAPILVTIIYCLLLTKKIQQQDSLRVAAKDKT